MDDVLAMDVLERLCDLMSIFDDQIRGQFSPSCKDCRKRLTFDKLGRKKNFLFRLINAHTVNTHKILVFELPQFVRLAFDFVDRFLPFDAWRNGDELENDVPILCFLPRVEDLLTTTRAETFQYQEWTDLSVFHRLVSRLK